MNRLWLISLAAALAVPCWSFAADTLQVLQDGPGAGHYLAWHGRPVLLCGDSVTQGWMECGMHFDQAAYVDALAAHGMNLLMLWAYKGTCAAGQRNDARLGYDAPELWPWRGSPDDRSFDLRHFNAAYFAHLQELVASAERRNIAVLITVHDGWTKTCFDGHPFNAALGNGPLTDKRQYVELADYGHELPAAWDSRWSRAERNQFLQEQFCARLIAALEPYSNVLYEMFNEGEWYDRGLRRHHEQHFLAFFRARCRNLLLSNCDHITRDDPHRDATLDLISWHPRDWIGHFPVFAAGFHRTPPKPHLYSEPVPEFDGRTPPLDVVRQSMWETLLAGAGWVNQNDLSFGWDPRAAVAAQAAARDRAYDDAGHCARFFNQTGVAFWKMTPQARLSSTGICLARPGVEYVAYAARGGPFTMDLSAAADVPLRVRWYNPRSGEFTPGQSAIGGQAPTSLTPPFAGDAVLHAQRTEGPG